MIIEALLTSIAVALCAMIGALFFGKHAVSDVLERYVVPVAVGVFFGLIFFGLVPKIVGSAGALGSLMIAGGFFISYVLAYLIHRKIHDRAGELCEQKEAAILLLIGDAFHNFADGIVIGGAFLISPEIGFITALAVALHEIPQEIVEFGVFVRAGYSIKRALVLNLWSASPVIVGTMLTLFFASVAQPYVWVVSAFAAGNLLYIASAELLPRLHSSHKQYGGFWPAFVAMLIGFVAMVTVVYIAHEHIGHGHEHETTEEAVHLD